ncbi:hypothetical protein [Bernardetia litoralis]|nr:hypothetical protein [Bernardetia litoralis]
MPNTYKSLGKAKQQQFLDSRARTGDFIYLRKNLYMCQIDAFIYKFVF